ncbi:MAG TPA: flagellar M-ring protein FliF C-terminal domain-containing protein, partial [Myxococcota bacterium]|nr:flagellar M-ring protein FliF C-terminal domain-containing protein [Myxococcota bacterium]
DRRRIDAGRAAPVIRWRHPMKLAISPSSLVVPFAVVLCGSAGCGGAPIDSSGAGGEPTTTTKPAGAIKRLSASVMINTEVLQAMLVAAAPDGKVDPAAEAALRADLEEAVRAALGYDPVRGDQVVVKFSRFADVQLSEAEVQPTMAVLERQSTNILLAIVLILAFVMVVRPLMRYLLSTPPSPVSAAQPAAAGALGAANAPMPASAESTEELNRRLRLAVENFESLSAQDLSELVSRESEHSAAVLRRWIRG